MYNNYVKLVESVNEIKEEEEVVLDTGAEEVKEETEKATEATEEVKEESEEATEETKEVKEGMKINTKVTEAEDATLKQIADVVKGKTLMSLRSDLEKIFKKKDIDFTMAGAPHYQIKHKGKTIMIVGKNNVDEADIIVGDIAIGYM